MTGSTPSASRDVDVLVIGGGNAALCAAIAARRTGASVVMLECAPHAERGGNSRYTRNLRFTHVAGNAYLEGPYSAEEFWDDLIRVTDGKTDEGLARFAIDESRDLDRYIEAQGARFQPPLRGTLGLARTNAFFFGGGKALINAYYETARKLGVDVRYEAEALDLEFEGRHCTAVRIRGAAGEERIAAHAIVIASGGYEANADWQRQHWGDAADNFIVRGTRFNQGRMLRVLLDRGAQPVGDPTQCHAIAVDARAPRHDGGIVTRLDCIPFGIVVNRDGVRFYDEGEEIWPKRYAIWGRLIARQPGQIAYALVDDKVMDAFMPSLYPPFEALSIAELAPLLGIDSRTLEATVGSYNEAVRPGMYRPGALDGCATQGISPPKSHWALRLDTPPYRAWPLKPGITFTYLGVAVDRDARVQLKGGGAMENVFAAGEIMAGNILGAGYLAGIGMTIGTIFGRIAGREAARHGKE